MSYSRPEPRPGRPLGTVVPNTAHIYFDFNPAVVTNTAQTVINSPSYFDPGAGDIVIRACPNPAAWYLSLSWMNLRNKTG